MREKARAREKERESEREKERKKERKIDKDRECAGEKERGIVCARESNRERARARERSELWREEEKAKRESETERKQEREREREREGERKRERTYREREQGKKNTCRQQQQANTRKHTVSGALYCACIEFAFCFLQVLKDQGAVHIPLGSLSPMDTHATYLTTAVRFHCLLALRNCCSVIMNAHAYYNVSRLFFALAEPRASKSRAVGCHTE